jgi:V8-like Glu-specific endopeptidase
MRADGRISKQAGNLDLISQKKFYILLGLIIGSIVCSELATAIYGGEPVRKGEFDAVGIVSSSCGYYSTGTLIQGNVVLTVAHLFDGCGDDKTAEFKVGDQSFSGKVELHKKYDGQPRYDIALIILKRNVSKEIVPIPIAVLKESKSKRLEIVGYGSRSFNCKESTSRKKYKCILCKEVGSPDYESCDKEKIAGTCEGDSGGPALNKNKQIVAIAQGDKRPDRSKKSLGIVLTEIDANKYIWIQQIMKEARNT